MKQQNILNITLRERAGKGAMRQLRREGMLPGSMSYKGEESVSFAVNKDAFRRLVNQNGLSGIYTLQVDKKTSYPAMVREVQYAPMTRDLQHVTFQRVSLTEETTADIAINVIGKEDVQHAGLELLQQLETVAVRGLPTDFPQAIDVDVSKMTAGEQVTVADLVVPEGLTVETEADRLILNVSYPRVQEEETPAAEGAEETASEEAAPAEEA